jgi:hypothetical protein
MASNTPEISEHRHKALVTAHSLMQVATTLKFTSLFQFVKNCDE